VSTVPTQHAVLHGIRWQTYERLRDELEGRHVRLTFDRGTLEIMSPSRRHEQIRHRLGRLIEAATEELGVAIEGGGSTTWARADLEKGLEPDECYWVQHEADVRGKDELDLRVDTPPDLAIEVDLRSASVDRMAIYGALGVPEVWRWRKGRLAIWLRRADGTYAAAECSVCFPWLPVGKLARWVARCRDQGETACIRAFREWVRTSIREA
jgi:Uma2 family endonuclease